MPVVSIGKDQALKMTPRPYQSEALLENVLINAPSLLVNDMDGTGKSEYLFIASQVQLPESGICDLLLVSTDGVPIVVEVKLAANQQIHREVIGQTIDYVSALTTLTVDELDSIVEGKLEAALRSFTADDTAFDAMWAIVGRNLRAGLARCIVAVDDAPPRLLRSFNFLVRSTKLDAQLISIKYYTQPDGGEIAVSTILVAPSADKLADLATPKVLPQFASDILTRYDVSPRRNMKSTGSNMTYRQIRPASWTPFGVHYEFMFTKDAVCVDLHLEHERSRGLADHLRSLDGRQLSNGLILTWHAGWRKAGRLTIQIPISDLESIDAVSTMYELIDLTYDIVDTYVTSHIGQ